MCPASEVDEGGTKVLGLGKKGVSLDEDVVEVLVGVPPSALSIKVIPVAPAWKAICEISRGMGNTCYQTAVMPKGFGFSKYVRPSATSDSTSGSAAPILFLY